MSFDRLKKWRWGLRARFTIYTSVIIAATLAAAYFWSVYNLRAVLLARNDAFLRNELIEAAVIVFERLRDSGDDSAMLAEIEREAKGNQDAGLMVVLRHEGEVYVFPDRDHVRALARALEPVPLSEVPGPVLEERPGLVARGARAIVDVPGAGIWTLEMILQPVETEVTVTQFNRRLAGGGAAFLAAAILGGLFLTRQALRPVAASIRSARELNPRDLSARLPRTGSDDELDQLAATINDLLERLARHHDQMVRFTADASHELRAPLAAMQAAAEVALQRPRPAGEYREHLEVVSEQCERLADVVGNLLLLARADAGQVPLCRESVDWSELAREAIDTFRPLADDKGLTLEFDCRAAVIYSGDRTRLLQLIMNLLDNAIKFTPQGGTVRVALTQGPGGARFVVQDTGIGIPADKLPHIFERFYQVDSSRMCRGGGLGLSICHWVATAHDGTIDVSSQPGRGTQFTVVLPQAV